jgi:hypothetical protein
MQQTPNHAPANGLRSSVRHRFDEPGGYVPTLIETFETSARS